MNYLLDTCVISELVKPRPGKKILSWLQSIPEENVFLSSITIGELQRGISRLPASRKKAGLQTWLDDDLMKRFDQRIIGIDTAVAKTWGNIQADTEKSGKKMPILDSLIAAIGIVHNLTVVTRNVSDLEASGVRLHNPF